MRSAWPDYRDRHQMAALAHRLRSSRAAPAKLAAAIHDLGLMKVRPWWARVLINLIRWRRHTSLAAWTPEMARELIERTADWVVNGRDLWTTDAAGGFSPGEVAKLVIILDQLEAA